MTRAARTVCLAVTAVLAAPSAAHAAVLTSGVLTGASGAPSAGQVRVYAFQLPDGDRARVLPLLGSAQAGTDGRFAVSTLNDAQLVELARARGGWLDLTAVADTPGAQAQWGFTVFVDAPGGTARVSSAEAVTTTAGSARVASAAPPTPHIRLHAARPLAFARAAQAPPCDTKLRTRKPETTRKLAIVGELNNAYNDGTRGKFTYAREQSAETAFGIAASYQGTTWTISGESMVTNKGKATFPRATKRYSRKLRSAFEFTKYEVQRSSCAVWETEIRATSWLGGTDSSLKQDGLDKCDPRQIVKGWEGGAELHRETGAAVRYTRAVEAFGVNLTSRSGFSKNVTLDYSFGGPVSKDHYLCGPDGRQSAMEAGRVFSGARR